MRAKHNQFYLPQEERYGEFFTACAVDFRNIALAIDENPPLIKHHFDLPGIQFLMSDTNSTALERTKYFEALSYGDPGVVLASPGPSLSGLMLRELGTPEQIDAFYSMIKKHPMRTFFALTEPNKGSDANNIETRLIRNGKNYFLNGFKCFFGNAAVAETGVVLAKLNDSPVGIRAVWLTPEIMLNSTVHRISLPMAALRGAQIGAMQFNHLEIPEACILGLNRSACETGMLSILKVFNRLRTGVGALAIGQAQAVLDIVFQLNQNKFNSNKSLFFAMYEELSIARLLLEKAARGVECNAYLFSDVSSSKIIATRSAEKVISACLDLCSFSELIENPWIVKSYRDVFCWEYMEGTTAIQKIQIQKKLTNFIKQRREQYESLSLSFAA